MSDDDSDSDSEGVIDSFAFIAKVKSNTPRARFDVHFYPTFIQLIQYNVQKEVSHRYRIQKENVSEMLRLPYNHGKQIFFVLHLKQPIIGGNKSTTKYDFVVFNFAEEDYEKMKLDLTDTTVRDMFSDMESEYISGQTIDVFEDMLVKIFEKDVTTPAKDFLGSRVAPALKCTFWDSDEHFLYVLDDGFINVWKYCQKIRLREVKNVRFVRSKGRFKTFDFYIYPKMQRAIRRYNIGSSKSHFLNCFFLEFKAIDQMHYDGLYAYCEKNKINLSTKDYKESASGSSDTDSRSSLTETNASGSDDTEPLSNDGFEAPDPHLVRCQTEGRGNDSDTGTSDDSQVSDEADTLSPDQPSTSDSQKVSQNSDNNSSSKIRRKQRRQNIIPDETDSSSSDGIVNSFDDKSKSKGVSPRKRSLRIESDDEEVEPKYVKGTITIDSESD